MGNDRPHRKSTGARRALRGLLKVLLAVILFVILAAALVFGLFAVSGATTQLPAAAVGGLPGTPTVEITASSTIPVERHEPTLTPFRPAANTPTPTRTSTPTPTPTTTPTASPTPTLTATATNTATLLPTDTPEPPADAPPEEAYISGVTGYDQSLPLSCESRSAVDWARYFGLEVGELEFQEMLPTSDNPNLGFVGSPYHERGAIPPYSYGVHAAPVARLLRSYGLNAHSYSGMSMDDIRREVAAGRPVIAWVVGNVWRGRGVPYTASDGETLTVVPFEHTVIVTGYSPVTVTVVDGGMMYSPTIERFLDSWSVLGWQGIVLE